MLHIEIPGRAPMDIANVVFDYNGTIAVDGKMLPELRERIEALLKLVPVYVLTADTYGTMRAQCEPLGMIVHTFPREGAAQCKEEIVKALPGASACFGNGFNDIEMFDAAALSVAILEGEGLCASLLPHADVLVRSAAEGLDLLLKEGRLKATLRS